MSSRAKLITVLLSVLIVGLLSVLVLSAMEGGTTKVARSTVIAREAAERAKHRAHLRARVRAQQEKAADAAAAVAVRERASEKASIEKTGIDGSPSKPPGSSTPHAEAKVPSSSSFARLESEISGEIGVAYASLGSAEAQQLGPLEVGHAWSSFKVPIVVTLMLEQNGSLSSGQEDFAASAITASDNEAAASLFAELESLTGGGASAAVEGTLAKALGGATQVATAPPPPGAVSSWGQTEWSLAASTSFYGALACGAYGEASNVLGYMESVIPEQQWGLGHAEFPAGTQVAFKAGWGPDGSESGPYLVRQAGIIRSESGGAVVTIAAQDSGGSFEAGVSDLNRVADWVAQNVPLSGSC